MAEEGYDMLTDLTSDFTDMPTDFKNMPVDLDNLPPLDDNVENDIVDNAQDTLKDGRPKISSKNPPNIKKSRSEKIDKIRTRRQSKIQRDEQMKLKSRSGSNYIDPSSTFVHSDYFNQEKEDFPATFDEFTQDTGDVQNVSGYMTPERTSKRLGLKESSKRFSTRKSLFKPKYSSDATANVLRDQDLTRSEIGQFLSPQEEQDLLDAKIGKDGQDLEKDKQKLVRGIQDTDQGKQVQQEIKDARAREEQQMRRIRVQRREERTRQNRQRAQFYPR